MNSRLILPVGLTCALLVAMCCPQPGLWLVGHKATLYFVATMFLINGYQTKHSAFSFGRRFVSAFLLTALISLIAGGYLVRLIMFFGHWNAILTVGMVVMAMMPPTLSSVVIITKESGGNTTWSVVMTIGLSLLSIVTIPVFLPRLLAHTAIDLPVWPLFIDLLCSVLLPLLVGMALRHYLQKAPPPLLNRVPTYIIIVLSYLSFSAGREMIVSNSISVIALIALTSLALHLALFTVSLGLARSCRFAVDEQKAIAFIGAQKTLPTAISVLTSLGVAGAGAAVPCVIYYLIQQLCDAVIAAIWHMRTVAINR